MVHLCCIILHITIFNFLEVLYLTETKEKKIYTAEELSVYSNATISKKLRENYSKTQLENLLGPARKAQTEAICYGSREEIMKFTFIYQKIQKVLDEIPIGKEYWEEPENSKRKNQKKIDSSKNVLPKELPPEPITAAGKAA